MAKKQTRRSISVSRSTYERLKAFCETSGISMSQFVETRVGDFLGEDGSAPVGAPIGQVPSPVVSASAAALSVERAPRAPLASARPQAGAPAPAPMRAAPAPARPAPPRPAPMTSAAARYAVDPPPPIIKKADQPAPKAPSMPKADQIFTF
jgi:hypothetical protein